MKKLSESQETLLNEISSKWINTTLGEKSFNKSVIQTFVDLLYWANGFREPEIHYAQSPLASQKLALELKLSSQRWQNLSKSMLTDMEQRIFGLPDVPRTVRYLIWGKAKIASLAKIHIEMQLRSYLMQVFEEFAEDFRNPQWCSLYDFCCEAGFIGRRRGIIDTYCQYVFNSGVFFTIYESSHVIVCPNPAEVKFNGRGELHSDEGAAVSWDDGFRLRFSNGVSADKSIALSSDYRDRLLFLFREETAEIRREILSKFGVDVFAREFRARIVDKWRTKWGLYELVTIDISNMTNPLTYLKMLNPSTGELHIEPVPEVMTCAEALAWRDGETEYVLPKLLT